MTTLPDPGAGYRLLVHKETIPEHAEYYSRGKWHSMRSDVNVGKPWNDHYFHPMRVSIGVEMTTLPDPGEGFRLLEEGDPIPSVVDYFFDGEWIPRRPDHHVGECWNPFSYLPMRVKIEPQDNVHTGGPYIAIEVHRAALAEIERLKAELDTRCDIWRLARDLAAEERDAAEKEVKRLKAELDAIKQRQPAESGYGFCSICGAPGVTRERRLNGNDRCSNGHEYQSRDALPQQLKTETVVFHEVIVDSAETGNRYLVWVELIDKRQGDIPTGRTETRELSR